MTKLPSVYVSGDVVKLPERVNSKAKRRLTMMPEIGNDAFKKMHRHLNPRDGAIAPVNETPSSFDESDRSLSAEDGPLE